MSRAGTAPRPAFAFACRSSRKTTVQGGYIREHCPLHPAADAFGTVPQHRLVMERALGRYLAGTELVHHRNGDKMDNCLENLQIVTRREHFLLHQRQGAMARSKRHRPEVPVKLREMSHRRTTQKEAALLLGMSVSTLAVAIRENAIPWRDSRKPLEEPSVREALEGRSTLEAAALLGVHHQTLRNRFPHLLRKRVSPGFLDAHKDEIRNRSMTETLSSIGARFGTSGGTIDKALHRWSKQDGCLVGTEYRFVHGPSKNPIARQRYVEAWRRRRRASGPQA